MLRITIVAVGKHKDSWIQEGVEHYLKLLRKHARVEFIALSDIKGGGKLPPTVLAEKESEMLMSRVPTGSVLVALSDSGKGMNSVEFSPFLDKTSGGGARTLVFLIGGAYGVSQQVLQRSQYHVSLSPLTFSHQLVRLVLLEQLYRGLDMLAGGAYHK